MKLMSAVLEAVVVTAGYYMAICILNRVYEMGYVQKQGWISDKLVLAVGIVTFLSTGMIGYIRLPGLIFPLYILTLLLIWGMSVLAVVDRRKQIIPNRFLIILLMLWVGIIGVSIIVETGSGIGLFFQSLTGGFAGGLIFLLCYLLSRKQLGAGDVKLAFVMGLYLTGQRIIGAIFYGVVLCCVYSVVQLCRKKVGLKDGIPLVPFLYMGVLITLFII